MNRKKKTVANNNIEQLSKFDSIHDVSHILMQLRCHLANE